MLLIFRTKANLSEKKVWHVIIDERRSLIKRLIYNVKECCRHHFSYFHNTIITKSFSSDEYQKKTVDVGMNGENTLSNSCGNRAYENYS